MHGHAFGMPWVKRADSAVWTPANLSPALWIEARAGDLWEDTGKTLPVVDLDPVRVWVPRTGGDLSAVSDGQRPTYRASAAPWGGRSVRFDGTDDRVTRSGHAGVVGAVTYGMRFSWVGANYGRIILQDKNSSGVGAQFRILSPTSIMVQCGVGNTTTNARNWTCPALGAGSHTLIIEWDGTSAINAAAYGVRLDGSLLTTPTTTATSQNGVATSDIHIGAAYGSILPSACHLGVVTQSAGVLSAGDRASLQAYLDGWM
jgi:hypothetical protein